MQDLEQEKRKQVLRQYELILETLIKTSYDESIKLIVEERNKRLKKSKSPDDYNFAVAHGLTEAIRILDKNLIEVKKQNCKQDICTGYNDLMPRTTKILALEEQILNCIKYEKALKNIAESLEQYKNKCIDSVHGIKCGDGKYCQVCNPYIAKQTLEGN